jgi:hypothetical protein
MAGAKGGWNAGKKPGKPGTVGKMFPLETKGAKGKLTSGKGKGK